MWQKGDAKPGLQLGPARTEKGLGAFDTLLVCMLVGILIATVFPYFNRITREAREVALRGGLNNIRMEIQLYHFLNQDYPADLKSLINEKFITSSRQDTFFKGEYLTGQTLDADGNMLDPFDNPYRYEKSRGKVVSGTHGYETW